MATLTEQRNMTAILIPKGFYKIIAAEAELLNLNFGTAVRAIVHWHRGEGLPRNLNSPVVKAPRPDKRSSDKEGKIKKSMMLDDADIEYIDKIALPYGLTRQAVLVLILADWFGLAPVCSPAKAK